MIVLLVSTVILKVFVDAEPRIYFSLEGKVVLLALLNLVAHLFSNVVEQTKPVPGTVNASKYHLEVVLIQLIIRISQVESLHERVVKP